jgi:hypothetical protein
MGTLATKQGLDLLIDYLDVCNTALEAHRHSLAYKPIILAYDRIFAKWQVAIDIYSHDPDKPDTTVTIRLSNGRFGVVPVSEAHPSFHLKLKHGYMEDVLAHRQEYIDHPEKLDWDWLKSRMGIEAHHGPAHGADMRPPEKEQYPAPAKGANMRPRSGRTE